MERVRCDERQRYLKRCSVSPYIISSVDLRPLPWTDYGIAQCIATGKGGPLPYASLADMSYHVLKKSSDFGTIFTKPSSAKILY